MNASIEHLPCTLFLPDGVFVNQFWFFLKILFYCFYQFSFLKVFIF